MLVFGFNFMSAHPLSCFHSEHRVIPAHWACGVLTIKEQGEVACPCIFWTSSKTNLSCIICFFKELRQHSLWWGAEDHLAGSAPADTNRPFEESWCEDFCRACIPFNTIQDLTLTGCVQLCNLCYAVTGFVLTRWVESNVQFYWLLVRMIRIGQHQSLQRM